LFKSGREKEGLKYLHKAVIFAPDEETFWANIANLYGMMGDYNQSVKVLKEGLKFIPNSPNLLLILAKSHINLKNYQKAVNLLETIDSDQKDVNENVRELIRKARQNIESNT